MPWFSSATLIVLGHENRGGGLGVTLDMGLDVQLLLIQLSVSADTCPGETGYSGDWLSRKPRESSRMHYLLMPQTEWTAESQECKTCQGALRGQVRTRLPHEVSSSF